MNKGGHHYTPAEDHMIRRMFNANASDREIAERLCRMGRQTGWEAVRKRRRVLGLKKVPTYQRWVWGAFAYV